MTQSAGYIPQRRKNKEVGLFAFTKTRKEFIAFIPFHIGCFSIIIFPWDASECCFLWWHWKYHRRIKYGKYGNITFIMHCIKTNYVKFSIHCHLFLSISIYIRVVILFGFYFMILRISSILSFHSSSFPSVFLSFHPCFFSFTIFFFISVRLPSLSPTES